MYITENIFYHVHIFLNEADHVKRTQGIFQNNQTYEWKVTPWLMPLLLLQLSAQHVLGICNDKNVLVK